MLRTRSVHSTLIIALLILAACTSTPAGLPPGASSGPTRSILQSTPVPPTSTPTPSRAYTRLPTITPTPDYFQLVKWDNKNKNCMPMAGIRNVEESSPRNWLVELEGDRPKMVIKFSDDPKGKLNGSITSVAFQMSSGKVVNYEIRSAYGALINLRLYGLFFGEGRGGDNILRILPSAYTVLCLTKDMAEKFENMIAPVMVYVRVVVQTPSMALSSETGFGLYGDSYCDMIKRYESQGARYALDKSEVFDASKTCPKTTIYLR